MKNNLIIEKELGIPPDYQLKALNSNNFLQSNWHNNKLVTLNFILQKIKPNRVLDLGAGSGNFEFKFHNKLKEIVGVDYNDEAIAFIKSELKRKRVNNVKLINGDLRKIDKIGGLGKFDLIILIDVIEHLTAFEAGKLISELKRFLTKKGKVCIITPNYDGFWPLLEKILDLFSLVPHMEGRQHRSKFSIKSLELLFTKRDYFPLYFSTFNLFSFAFFNKRLSSFLCKIELKLKLSWGNLLIYLFETNE